MNAAANTDRGDHTRQTLRTGNYSEGRVPLPPISVSQFGQAFGLVLGQALQNLQRDIDTHFGGDRRTVNSGPTAAERQVTVPTQTPAQMVAPIIERVEDDSARRTLEGFDPRIIQAVGRTVDKARRRNPDITDREIYLLFHKAVSNVVDPDPILLEGRKVIDLLMGGLNGSLPF